MGVSVGTGVSVGVVLGVGVTVGVLLGPGVGVLVIEGVSVGGEVSVGVTVVVVSAACETESDVDAPPTVPDGSLTQPWIPITRLKNTTIGKVRRMVISKRTLFC